MSEEQFTSYEVDNDRRFRNALSDAQRFVDDFKLPFNLILKDFYTSQKSIFGLKGPGKYPAFKGELEDNGKTRYQNRKIKKYGFDYPLLVASGRLANSLLGPTNPGSIANITAISLTFGTSIPYGIYHQSDKARRKIPLRKYLFIGPEAPSFATSEQMGRLQRWLGYINDHVANQMIKAGLASKIGGKR